MNSNETIDDNIQTENDSKKSNDTNTNNIEKTLKTFGKIFVRQLYRMQYGYKKLTVFISILNTVSLLMVAFSLEKFFNIKWWHMVLIYVGIIFFLLLSVYFIELFGAWHSEKKQIFNMQRSKIWRDKIELQTLLLTKYLDYPEEEIDKRIQAVKQKLFPE